MSESLYDVAAVSDLKDGQMKEVEAESKKVLLARVDGQFYATDAHCPHYGVSLAEGILCGERVVCPWHKSVFSVKTGDLLEPPALDSLTSYKVSVKGERIFVHVPDGQPKTGPVLNEPDSTCFALIGAGAASVAAAEQLRDLGFMGRLVLLSGEPEPPYDRTKLSKEFLSGNAQAGDLALRPPEFWEQHAIERLTQPVTDLDPAAHQLHLANGSSLAYDRLLIASGSTPKALDVPGADLGNIFTLRSQADAEAIWQQAQPGVRIAIVGGSLIALEVASCFAMRRLPVTVIVSDETPFAKQFGCEVGRIFQQWHESHGVEFRVEAEVDHFEGVGMVRSVVLKSGEKIPADIVVVGAGVQPATGFTGSLPKQDDGGLLTDSFLRVADDIYAAGDIVFFPESYSGITTRIEHWRVAEQHGRAAARNMLGSQHAFAGVPYFWTNHFGTRFDYVGHAKEWDEVFLQFGAEAPTFIAFYVSDGVVKAAAACHRDNEIAALHELIRLKKVPTPEEIRRGADLIALAAS